MGFSNNVSEDSKKATYCRMSWSLRKGLFGSVACERVEFVNDEIVDDSQQK